MSDKPVKKPKYYGKKVTTSKQDEAIQKMIDKGFNIVAKASEFENYIFFADNWAEDFRELKTGLIRQY